MFARSLLLTLATLCAAVVSARITWICGEGTPMDVPAVAENLKQLLNEEVEVVTANTTYLSVWANDPKSEDERLRLLSADRLFITLSEREPFPLAILGLDAIGHQRTVHRSVPLVVAAQRPVYKMKGLCNNRRLQEIARVSLGAEMDFVALPKVWQQVYTDDTFYYDRVPKGVVTESYIFACGIALALTDEECDLPPLAGIHEDVADDLIDSIEDGYDLTEDVLYAARHLAYGTYNLRLGNAFTAVLYDGAFEHAIGDWLMKLAKADGRELTLHYTTDTKLDTGVPCLFRTTHALGKAPNAFTYTRPAFKDDSGLTELDHLVDILNRDLKKQNWMPFPLAVADWTRVLTGHPVYNGTVPSNAAAAMFAAMLYLEWTGSAVLPADAGQLETVAIGIGLDVMLRMRLQRANVNAIFCRPIDDTTYTFSLWRRPTEKVTLQVSAKEKKMKVKPKKLTFTPDNYWAPQTVTVDAPCTLLWKIPTKTFPGQNTGARFVGEQPQPEEPASEESTSEETAEELQQHL